jgi:hypothetical protein
MLKSRTNSASTGSPVVRSYWGLVDTLLKRSVGEFWDLELVRFGLSEGGVQVSWLWGEEMEAEEVLRWEEMATGARKVSYGKYPGYGIPLARFSIPGVMKYLYSAFIGFDFRGARRWAR